MALYGTGSNVNQTTDVSAGNYGSSTAIPIITIDSDKRISAINTASVTTDATVNANASIGGVGTYAFLQTSDGNTSHNPGANASGSDLRYSDATGRKHNNTTPSGSWKCMGYNSGAPLVNSGNGSGSGSGSGNISGNVQGNASLSGGNVQGNASGSLQGGNIQGNTSLSSGNIQGNANVNVSGNISVSNHTHGIPGRIGHTKGSSPGGNFSGSGGVPLDNMNVAGNVPTDNLGVAGNVNIPVDNLNVAGNVPTDNLNVGGNASVNVNTNVSVNTTVAYSSTLWLRYS